MAFKQRPRKDARAVEFEPDSVPAVLVARPLDQEDKELANLDAIGAQMGIGSAAIKRFHAVKDEVQRVLGHRHGVRVVVASMDLVDADAVRNIERQIAAAHFGIADITGNNPNVMWELGLMLGLRKPVIVLKDKTDSERTPFDVYSRLRVHYQVVSDDATGRREFALLESGLESNMKLIEILRKRR